MKGIVCTLLAYVLWGLFPFYFHALAGVDAMEILAHRIAWSLLFAAILLVALRRTAWIPKALRDRRTMLVFTASALLVGANWGIYVYSIVSGRTIEASLGYFINPLVSMILGAAFLHERLGRVQAAAVAIAAAGVAWITWSEGVAPVLGLGLALTFGLYGLIRKIAPLGSLEGFSLETMILAPLALLWIWHLDAGGELAFAAADLSTQLLLVAAGPVTAVPLLLFAAGVRLIPYSTTAIIQYVSPSIVFLIGVFAFGEPFGAGKLAGFALIWIAVALFLGETFVVSRRMRAAARERAAKN